MSIDSETKLPPLVKGMRVQCEPENAFALFTAHLHDWWPLATHSVSAENRDEAVFCAIEPRIGGRVYERSRSGRQHIWGTVLAWSQLAVSWHPGRAAVTAQTVTVTFRRTGNGTETELTLTHSGWENLGTRAEETRSSYEGRWEIVLGGYVTDAA